MKVLPGQPIFIIALLVDIVANMARSYNSDYSIAGILF